MNAVAAAFGSRGVVPVVTVEEAEDGARVAAAIRRGGLDAIEITFRTAAAAAAIRAACEVPGILVGAGTVRSRVELEAAHEAGAAFAVAPSLIPELVRDARELSIPYAPGVATPTEVEAALALGLEVVKVFPVGSLGGRAFLAALAAVFPGLSFLPTGGVGQSDLPGYLQLPSVVACGGSWIAPAELIGSGDFEQIERRARAAAEAAR